VADDEARFREVNGAALALLKYSELELLSMYVWDITVAPQRGDAAAMWREFLKAGHQAGVYQIERSDGRRVTVQYEAVANFKPGRHLSILRPVSASQPESRPLDECPFERPFPRDFDRCPASQPLLAPMSNSRDEAVQPVWTCEHLSATRLHPQARYYGRCGLGDALGRSRWLAAAADNGLLEIRALRVEFYKAAAAELSELIAAQAAIKSGTMRPGDRNLDSASRAVLGTLDAFAGERSGAFASAGLDPALLRRCLEATLSLATHRIDVEAMRPPAELVAGYPRAVQAFLRPDLMSAQPE
jgi:PAS domain S-box-containing protein